MAGRLTPKQNRTIGALITSRSVIEAAQLAHVGERSVRRWLIDPSFRAALLQAEERAIDFATRRLIGLQDSAIDVLKKIMENSRASSQARLRASLGILAHVLRLRELRSIEERISALEKSLEVKK